MSCLNLRLPSTLVRSPTSTGRCASESSTASRPETRERRWRGIGPRLAALSQPHQRGDVGGGRAAAAAHQVEPAGVEEAGEDALEDLRPFRVLPLLVGQAGVGNAGHPRAADLGERAHVVRHQVRTGGAVEAHVQEVGVEQRHRERLGVLPAEHRAGGLDGGRDRDRDLPARLGERPLDADQPGLDVARVLRRSRAAGSRRRRPSAPEPGRGSVSISPSKVMPPVTEIALVVGPMEPQTKRGFSGRVVSGAGATGDGGRQAVQLESLMRRGRTRRAPAACRRTSWSPRCRSRRVR